MKIVLPLDHPLAVAVMAASIEATETWLVLKSPAAGETHFRAAVEKWSSTANDTLHIEFETFESYMDRKARLMGL
jgi:hypothetical protein